MMGDSGTTWAGIPVVFDWNCLADTDQRLFPASKHRSARIHKKLVKRFGGEFVRKPAIFHVKGVPGVPEHYRMHPTHKPALMRAVRANNAVLA